ncbi:MAG: hypothetical protein [aquatic viral metagenome]
MKAFTHLLITILVPTLAGMLAVILWMGLEPYLGSKSYMVLAGLVTAANLLSLFIVGVLNGSEAAKLFMEVYGGWISELSSEVRRLMEVQRSAIITLEELSEQLASPKRTVQRIAAELDRITLPLSVEMNRLISEKVTELLNELEVGLEEARRVWFRSLPFVEEIKQLPESERRKALELWFEGLDGDPEKWRELAQYFRNRSRK